MTLIYSLDCHMNFGRSSLPLTLSASTKEEKHPSSILWYVAILREYKLTKYMKIVDEASSKLGLDREVLIPIDATHQRICKFQSETDPLLLPIVGQIKRCSAQITRSGMTPGNAMRFQLLLLLTNEQQGQNPPPQPHLRNSSFQSLRIPSS